MNLATRHRQKHKETGEQSGLDNKAPITWKIYFTLR